MLMEASSPVLLSLRDGRVLDDGRTSDRRYILRNITILYGGSAMRNRVLSNKSTAVNLIIQGNMGGKTVDVEEPLYNDLMKMHF